MELHRYRTTNPHFPRDIIVCSSKATFEVNSKVGHAQPQSVTVKTTVSSLQRPIVVALKSYDKSSHRVSSNVPRSALIRVDKDSASYRLRKRERERGSTRTEVTRSTSLQYFTPSETGGVCHCLILIVTVPGETQFSVQR